MTSPSSLPLPPNRTILTPRLRLRTARLSDAAACQPIICDDETMKYSTTGAVAKNDLGAVENWLRARVLGKEVFQFLVTLRKDEEEEEVIVGMMGSHHWGEVGYLFDPGTFDGFFFPFLILLVSLHMACWLCLRRI
jgi:RimJ/RimL family protein N-acetyltransferase